MYSDPFISTDLGTIACNFFRLVSSIFIYNKCIADDVAAADIDDMGSNQVFGYYVHMSNSHCFRPMADMAERHRPNCF